MRLKCLLVMSAFLLISTSVFAHTPLCSCFDNGDNTITCEGLFSDGSSASGVKMFVKTADDKVLLEGAMSEDSEYTFDKPEGDYYVLFDGGEGHQIKVPGKEIVE